MRKAANYFYYYYLYNNCMAQSYTKAEDHPVDGASAFTDLASTSISFPMSVPGLRTQVLARPSPTVVSRTPPRFGAAGAEDPVSKTLPLPRYFYQVLPICKCWAPSAKTHTDTVVNQLQTECNIACNKH